jgi:hypothetical protein
MADSALAEKTPLAMPPVAALLTVDRAIADLRRGGVVVITSGHHTPLLVQAAEAISDDHLARFRHLAKVSVTNTLAVRLFLTGRRAAVLGLSRDSGGTVEVHFPHGVGWRTTR